MHRRESIIAEVLTNLTGLTTTGSNVARARAYNHDTSALPALTVSQGDDNRSQDADLLGTTQRRLAIEITAHARATTNLETVLNQISAEVFAALVADRTQGLAYVFNTEIDGESAPDIDGGETEQPVARMTLVYAIDYEHSNTSAEA